MSEYLYHCEDCDREFALEQHMSEHEAGHERGVETCPHCGGNRVHQLVTAFSAVTSKKS